MQKILLSLGLVAGISFVAQAQSISYGIKAGASLTNFIGGSTSDFKNVFGFSGGLVANFAIDDAFSIQPELLYSMKGAKKEGNDVLGGNAYSYRRTVNLHYIDVPVLARVNAGGLFFELGPQVSFLATAKQKTEITGGILSGNSTDDIKKDTRSVDFGYAAGLGYQLSNGPGIGLRYNGGFSDLGTNSNGNSGMRNSAFQLYLSYMFGGK